MTNRVKTAINYIVTAFRW